MNNGVQVKSECVLLSGLSRGRTCANTNQMGQLLLWLLFLLLLLLLILLWKDQHFCATSINMLLFCHIAYLRKEGPPPPPWSHKCVCEWDPTDPALKQAFSLVSHKWTWLFATQHATSEQKQKQNKKTPPFSSPLGPGWLPRLPCRLCLPHVAMRLGPTDLSWMTMCLRRERERVRERRRRPMRDGLDKHFPHPGCRGVG